MELLGALLRKNASYGRLLLLHLQCRSSWRGSLDLECEANVGSWDVLVEENFVEVRIADLIRESRLFVAFVASIGLVRMHLVRLG